MPEPNRSPQVPSDANAKRNPGRLCADTLSGLPEIDRADALKASATQLLDAILRLDQEEEALKEKVGPSLPLALTFVRKKLKLGSVLLRTLTQLRKSDELKWKKELAASGIREPSWHPEAVGKVRPSYK